MLLPRDTNIEYGLAHSFHWRRYAISIVGIFAFTRRSQKQANEFFFLLWYWIRWSVGCLYEIIYIWVIRFQYGSRNWAADSNNETTTAITNILEKDNKNKNDRTQFDTHRQKSATADTTRIQRSSINETADSRK